MPSPTPPAPSPPKAASGPQRALHKLGLHSDIDLALHLPLRYEDETRLTPISALRDGEVAQVEGVIADSRIETRPRRQLLVLLREDGAELLLRFLHFYPSQQKNLAVGARVRARGEVRSGFFGREMVHPAFRLVAEGAALPSALTPIYPSSAQLPQAYLRKAVVSGLARAPLDEALPAALLPAGLPPLREALHFLHHPPPSASLSTLMDHTHPAWQRLKFEELLAQQLSQAQAKRERQRLAAPALAGRAAGGLQQRLLAALPFALTAAQQRVGVEIAADLAREQPMHRLLQGDVGSGKTVVAALAAAVAIDSGWQCALMAPTEILAEQHFRKLVHWLEPLGVGVAWLTGSRKGKARAAMVERVASGEATLGGGHPCGDPGRRALRPARAGDHRRAAPFRRAAAPGAARQAGRRWSGAAPADDDRHADPAHAGDDLLRRPGRQHHRRTAARAHAGADQGLRRQPPRRGDGAHPRRGAAGPAGVLGLPADRREPGARPAQRHCDPRRAERGAARHRGRPAARALEARPTRPRRWRASAPARCRCWWRPR